MRSVREGLFAFLYRARTGKHNVNFHSKDSEYNREGAVLGKEFWRISKINVETRKEE